MKKTLALLAASTALTAAIGLPSWSAIRDHAEDRDRPFAAVPGQGEAAPVVLASDDDDDRRHRRASRHDDDDDDDDDDEGGRGARNPAPAGAVAPPQNGLFGTGAPPQVRVN